MDRSRLTRALIALYELVARLRGPGGCPWDARQTYDTVKMYLLEECYEVLDAVERGLPHQVCQELGDLLFQILFLASMAEDEGEFDMVKVMEEIHEKMVRRHPHVFGKDKVESPEDVSRNWARIKENERAAGKDPASPLANVPAGLPALLRAHRLSERAAGALKKENTDENPWAAVGGALREVEKAIAETNPSRVEQTLGRLLFGLANLARQWGLNAEDLLRQTNQQFIEGFAAASTRDKGR